MTKFTLKATATLTVLALVFGTLQAQTEFWSEDFSGGGLPAGWTTGDESGGPAEWTWCDDPNDAVGAGCVQNWANYADQHEDGFFSTTADNGFAVMDSDALGGLAANHIAVLTTDPIDCSGQAEVWVKMESLIGVFELPTLGNAVLYVSTDQVAWEQFDLMDITTAERWSLNPEVTIVDISSAAAGESTVYIQWSWTGNYEYYWLLDDVALYDADPSSIFLAANDLRVNSNFYAVAPNLYWPLSQAEEFGFLADIQNIGVDDQTNVNLNLTITDLTTSTVVYEEDNFYGNIASDSLAENDLFDGDGFLPTAMTVYEGVYTISADATDDDPSNNTQSFQFAMTDTLFAKDNGVTLVTRPADDEWNVGDGWSWAYGTVFHVVDGTDLYARYVDFAIDGSAVGGQTLLIKLYKWVDLNGDGNLDGDPDERIALGIIPYTITGSEMGTNFISLPITDLSGNPVPLEDDTDYVMAIEYQTDIEGTTVEIGMSNAVDYSAQIFRSEELGAPRYASVLGIGANLDSEPYSSTGFGGDFVPAISMSVGDPLTTSVSDLLDAGNTLEVFPNPATDYVNLQMDFVEPMEDVTVQLFDATGKLLQVQQFENVKSQQATFETLNLHSGAYMLHVTTETGQRTERFVVQK